jgi:hypothetical protein
VCLYRFLYRCLIWDDSDLAAAFPDVMESIRRRTDRALPPCVRRHEREGNGGLYHYYACFGRQKRGPKGGDGDRSRGEAGGRGHRTARRIYRDGHLIR